MVQHSKLIFFCLSFFSKGGCSGLFSMNTNNSRKIEEGCHDYLETTEGNSFIFHHVPIECFVLKFLIKVA